MTYLTLVFFTLISLALYVLLYAASMATALSFHFKVNRFKAFFRDYLPQGVITTFIILCIGVVYTYLHCYLGRMITLLIPALKISVCPITLKYEILYTLLTIRPIPLLFFYAASSLIHFLKAEHPYGTPVRTMQFYILVCNGIACFFKFIVTLGLLHLLI